MELPIELPIEFRDRMRKLLDKEFDEYIKSFELPSYSGIRVNTLKISPQKFESICPFPIKRIPWVNNGYYYNDDVQPAKHPYYHAGLYYIQEPSAMAPASLLPVQPGDKVLDLCAAPGGKSTELGAKLQGEGLLVSNDISTSRAKALLKNITLFGIKNALVLSESPEKLEGYFPEFFDKILVDAPCSGEGMFKRTPAIIKDWEEKGVNYYYQLQKGIMFSAAKMLKPGGYMLYSTCTFSPEENEGVISYLLDNFPDISIVDAFPSEDSQKNLKVSYEGFSQGRPQWIDGRKELEKCIRLWPHHIKGDGHFIALLRRDLSNAYSGKESLAPYINKSTNELSKEAEEFLSEIKINNNSILKYKEQFSYHRNQVLHVPDGLPELTGLRILREGLLLGEIKKKRFEPSQALANSLKINEYNKIINLSSADMNIIRYLKCEAIQFDKSYSDGWYLVCVDGYPLGWGKMNRNNFKNKYFPGWRWR